MLIARGSCPSDRRFAYVPFASLAPADQDHARRMFPHKHPRYPDEVYHYPILRNGALAYAHRYLSTPQA